MDALKARQREAMIDMIVGLMRDYVISPEDLAASFAAAPPKGGAARDAKAPPRALRPKYRNPATGETWAGRGKLPRWLAAAEADGQPRARFLIAADGPAATG